MMPAIYKTFSSVVNIAAYTDDSSAYTGFGFHTTNGGFRIRHLGGGGDIFFSFDGTNDHGVVSPTGRVEVVMERVRANQVFLRANTGGTGLESVEVQAWGGQ